MSFLQIIRQVVADVLVALYQPFWFSFVLAVLFMFLYLFARQYGWKTVVQKWLTEWKKSSEFRRIFFLAFYTAMILMRTLLNRDMWANPVSDVLGNWGLHYADGSLSTEPVENVILFIPFTWLVLWALQEKWDKIKQKSGSVIWRSVKISFIFSLSIELLQLFLRLGTFQLSDLFYNTIGGVIGGVIYLITKR